MGLAGMDVPSEVHRQGPVGSTQAISPEAGDFFCKLYCNYIIIINNNKPICNAPDASVTDPEAYSFPVSALTLLVGRQEEHLPVKTE